MGLDKSYTCIKDCVKNGLRHSKVGSYGKVCKGNRVNNHITARSYILLEDDAFNQLDFESGTELRENMNSDSGAGTGFTENMEITNNMSTLTIIEETMV